MQSNDITKKFALLTRQELAYLSGGLPELTNIQKSKINYKIKKKLEIFEKIELPLLLRAGLKPMSVSPSVENDKEDCHSFDPGSKFGLGDIKNSSSNGHPGPGAPSYSFLSVSNSNLEKLNKKQETMRLPLIKTATTHSQILSESMFFTSEGYLFVYYSYIGEDLIGPSFLHKNHLRHSMPDSLCIVS